MARNLWGAVGLVLAGAALTGAPAAARIAYKVTTLTALPGFDRGAVGDVSFGINNAGHSIGRMTNGPDGDRATVWDRAGHPTELGAPDGTWFGKADAINNHGVISGDIGVGTPGDIDNRRAVRWTTSNSYQFFLPDNGHTSTADVINDNGWIGGLRYTVPNDDATFQAYVWSPDGTTRWIDATVADGRIEWFGVNNSNLFTGSQARIGDEDGTSYDAVIWSEHGGVATLPGLGGLFRSASGINNNGSIVGAEYDGNITDTGLWWDAAHQVHTLDFLPGNTTSVPNALNDLGKAVGWSADTPNCNGFADRTCRRATIWTLGGGVANLNDLIDPMLGDTLLFANTINDRGEIQGEAVDAAGHRFLFLANAVPEPSSWAMLIAGFAVVGVAARRRRQDETTTRCSAASIYSRRS